MNPFKVGDWVVVDTGYAPRIVTKVTGTFVHTEYIGIANARYNLSIRPYPYNRFRFYENQPQEESPQMKLYETKDGQFGTYLATRQNGDYVLDLPEGPKAFDPKTLTEVMPYTISIQGCNAATSQAVQVNQSDNLAVNDIIVVTDANPPFIAVVKALDTKKRDARPLTYKKLMTA